MMWPMPFNSLRIIGWIQKISAKGIIKSKLLTQLATYIHTELVFRGFNFRNFVNGKAYAPLPKVFEDDQAFLERFSRVFIIK